MNTSPAVDDMMEAYAADAVDNAHQTLGITLDFTYESVRLVEDILSQLHRTIPHGVWRFIRRGPSRETMDLICKMYGGYIGEVVRKTSGGTWAFEDAFASGPLITLNLSSGAKIFPPSKVWKRLNDGPGDNVWSYFKVVTEEFRK
ncbi:MAG: hypothetical protein IPO17_06255 [Flavobacteriales bacterium]|nr:hypothetical protein [Flavobacteriales bacterium]